MCHFFKVEIKTGALKNAIKKKGLERPKQEDQDTKRRIFLLFPPNACMHVQSLSHVRLFVTPWTIACKAPLTMGFSRQEYWSGLPCPPPGDLPDPGIKPPSPALKVDLSSLSPQGSLGNYLIPVRYNLLSLLLMFRIRA